MRLYKLTNLMYLLFHQTHIKVFAMFDSAEYMRQSYTLWNLNNSKCLSSYFGSTLCKKVLFDSTEYMSQSDRNLRVPSVQQESLWLNVSVDGIFAPIYQLSSGYIHISKLLSLYLGFTLWKKSLFDLIKMGVWVEYILRIYQFSI